MRLSNNSGRAIYRTEVLEVAEMVTRQLQWPKGRGLEPPKVPKGWRLVSDKELEDAEVIPAGCLVGMWEPCISIIDGNTAVSADELPVDTKVEVSRLRAQMRCGLFVFCPPGIGWGEYVRQWQEDHPPREKPESRAAVCSVEGCERPAMKRGLCNSHYTREMVGKRTAVCSAEGCEQKVIAKGMCSRHYQQHRRAETQGAI